MASNPSTGKVTIFGELRLLLEHQKPSDITGQNIHKRAHTWWTRKVVIQVSSWGTYTTLEGAVAPSLLTGQNNFVYSLDVALLKHSIKMMIYTLKYFSHGKNKLLSGRVTGLHSKRGWMSSTYQILQNSQDSRKQSTQGPQ